MGNVTEPRPVKLFVGLLSRSEELFHEAGNELVSAVGNIDLESPVWTWQHTSYYAEEMGQDLKRQFLFVEELIHPGELSEIKVATNAMEQRHRNQAGGRKINIDPGYLDAAKLVLASTKDFSHRIYLDKGIYGEVTLYYADRQYRPFPYTFPDYRTEAYLEVFNKARDLYMRKMKT